MPKFLIERRIPDAGKLTAEELCAASRNSKGVLDELGTEIQWVQTYVSPDRITCVYIAANEKLVREHAARAGLPADAIHPVSTVIDPTTAEGVPVRA